VFYARKNGSASGEAFLGEEEQRMRRDMKYRKKLASGAATLGKALAYDVEAIAEPEPAGGQKGEGTQCAEGPVALLWSATREDASEGGES